MVKILRTNTALLLCTAFILKMLLLNVGFAASANTRPYIAPVKSHLTATMQRRRHFEPSADTKTCAYPVVEICEENDNEEDNHFKPNPLSFLRVFYSFFTDKVKNGFTGPSFSKDFSYTSLDRYLLLQVVRI
jgi:hypothetical protein